MKSAMVRNSTPCPTLIEGCATSTIRSGILHTHNKATVISYIKYMHAIAYLEAQSFRSSRMRFCGIRSFSLSDVLFHTNATS